MRRMSNMMHRERCRYARNYNIHQVGNDQHLEMKERNARKKRTYKMLLKIHEQHQKDNKEENK